MKSLLDGRYVSNNDDPEATVMTQHSEPPSDRGRGTEATVCDPGPRGGSETPCAVVLHASHVRGSVHLSASNPAIDSLTSNHPHLSSLHQSQTSSQRVESWAGLLVLRDAEGSFHVQRLHGTF